MTIVGRLHERLRPWQPLERARAVAAGASWAPGPEQSWHPAGARLRIWEPDGRSLAVHAVSAGVGRDLLLLHGFVQSSWCWRAALPGLAARARVHAVCLPGFGWSDKPRGAAMDLRSQAARLLRWADAAGVQDFDIAGCSLGGALALELAASQPTRVGRVVLVNPAGPGAYPMALAARLQHPALAPLYRLPGVPTGLRLGLQHAAYPGFTIDDEYMRHFLAPLRGDGALEAALAAAAAFADDVQALPARLAAVHQPALVVRGGRDRVVPAAVVEAIARGLRQVERRLYPGSGHCPMEEEPERFIKDVSAFLA